MMSFQNRRMAATALLFHPVRNFRVSVARSIWHLVTRSPVGMRVVAQVATQPPVRFSHQLRASAGNHAPTRPLSPVTFSSVSKWTEAELISYLSRTAERYLSRYSASSAHFRSVLVRRVHNLRFKRTLPVDPNSPAVVAAINQVSSCSLVGLNAFMSSI